MKPEFKDMSAAWRHLHQAWDRMEHAGKTLRSVYVELDTWRNPGLYKSIVLPEPKVFKK